MGMPALRPYGTKTAMRLGVMALLIAKALPPGLTPVRRPL